MSKEITLEDLVASSGSSGASEAASAAADAAADEDTGKWILELYERLEDDGMLQAIMFGPDAIPAPDGADVPADVEAAQNGAQAGGIDVDAEVVADALEDVQNTVGDLRISQLVKLTRENPGLVDNLLEDHLAGDVDDVDDVDDLEDVDDGN